MNYWLMKSEPSTFGIEHLAKIPKQTYYWDGVRNYQARNMLRDDMKKGDLAFFYHSNCNPPGIVGLMEIVTDAYPDFTAFDPDNEHFDAKSDPAKPRWYMVDVQLKKKFKHMVTLATLRFTPALSQMQVLQRGNRLSITRVNALEWETILELSK